MANDLVVDASTIKKKKIIQCDMCFSVIRLYI